MQAQPLGTMRQPDSRYGHVTLLWQPAAQRSCNMVEQACNTHSTVCKFACTDLSCKSKPLGAATRPVPLPCFVSGLWRGCGTTWLCSRGMPFCVPFRSAAEAVAARPCRKAAYNARPAVSSDAEVNLILEYSVGISWLRSSCSAMACDIRSLHFGQSAHVTHQRIVHAHTSTAQKANHLGNPLQSRSRPTSSKPLIALARNLNFRATARATFS